jgi:hypothetical protein
MPAGSGAAGGNMATVLREDGQGIGTLTVRQPRRV